jgi:hypothetical protein
LPAKAKISWTHFSPAYSKKEKRKKEKIVGSLVGPTRPTNPKKYKKIKLKTKKFQGPF